MLVHTVPTIISSAVFNQDDAADHSGAAQNAKTLQATLDGDAGIEGLGDWLEGMTGMQVGGTVIIPAYKKY